MSALLRISLPIHLQRLNHLKMYTLNFWREMTTTCARRSSFVPTVSKMATKQEQDKTVPIRYVASGLEENKKETEYHILLLHSDGQDYKCYLGTPEMNVLYDPLVHAGNDSLIWVFKSTTNNSEVCITNKVISRSNHLMGQPTYMKLGTDTDLEGGQKAYNVVMLGGKRTFRLHEKGNSKIFAISTSVGDDETELYLRPHDKQKVIVAVPSMTPHYIFQLIKYKKDD